MRMVCALPDDASSVRDLIELPIVGVLLLLDDGVTDQAGQGTLIARADAAECEMARDGERGLDPRAPVGGGLGTGGLGAACPGPGTEAEVGPARRVWDDVAADDRVPAVGRVVSAQVVTERQELDAALAHLHLAAEPCASRAVADGQALHSVEAPVDCLQSPWEPMCRSGLLPSGDAPRRTSPARPGVPEVLGQAAQQVRSAETAGAEKSHEASSVGAPAPRFDRESGEGSRGSAHDPQRPRPLVQINLLDLRLLRHASDYQAGVHVRLVTGQVRRPQLNAGQARQGL